MKNFKRCAMRCTQEQFESIKDRIPLITYGIRDFDEHPYLVISCKGWVTNSSLVNREYHIYEEFDADLFLEHCRVEQRTEKQIIDEYLKNKFWKGRELQFRACEGASWNNLHSDFQYRIKPIPNYSAEIEALQNKVKENNQKITIKIEDL